MEALLKWVQANPLISFALFVALVLVVRQLVNNNNATEMFSTCYMRKQIYLNRCDPDEPTGMADVMLEKRFGKLHVTINANLPYANGGVFHTMYGAYHCFLVNSITGQSINLGTLVRHGDRFYKLATGILGDYSPYDRIDVYRQTEDYAPKKVLTGSITQQGTSVV